LTWRYTRDPYAVRVSKIIIQDMDDMWKKLVRQFSVKYSILRMILARRIASICICLLILAITIPNLGRINLATHTVYYVWQDALWVVIVLVPMILTLAGINRSKALEGIGWVLMSILWVMVFSE